MHSESSQARFKPEWLVFALPGFSFLYIVHFSIGGIPTNLFEVLVYLVAVITFFMAKKQLHISPRMWVIIASIIALLFIQVIISPSMRDALGMIKGWVLPGALFAWMMYRFGATRSSLTILLMLMTAQGALIALLALLQQTSGFALQWISFVPDSAPYILDHRSVALFNSPNAAAMILAISCIAALSQVKKPIEFLAPVVIFFGLLATGSRGGILAVVVATMAYYLWRFGKGRLSVALVGLVALAFNPITLSLLAQRHPDSMDIRVHIWQKTWVLLRHHTLFGIGLTSFQDKFTQLTLHLPNFDEYITPFAVHPHNIFLYTWLLFGLVGLVLLVWLIYKAFTVAMKNNSSYSLVGVAMLSVILIHGMVDNTVWRNDLVIWFVAALFLTTIKAPAKSSK